MIEDKAGSPKPLQEGFSTGSAASAAAFAAVRLLFDAPLPVAVEVALPPFYEDNTPFAGEALPRSASLNRPPTLVIPIEQGRKEGPASYASVIKNGGDDPDVTHGARIIVHASLRPFLPCGKNSAQGSGVCRPRLPEQAGRRYAKCIKTVFNSRTLFLYGGTGIGTVTLPGLPAAVGEPAVNPAPRKQIAVAASAAANTLGYAGPLHLLLSVPDGEARARHTLNPRLGIVGGISILGTRGTVRPFSHRAWKATVAQSLNVAAAIGLRTILLATGRRSERLGFALYPDLPAQAGIQIADYAAFSLREAARLPFKRILWVCFPGKLLKLAQGLAWTHAAAAPTDIPLLVRYCREAGGPEALLAAIGAMPTASGALALMRQHNARLGKAVLERLAREAMGKMLPWLRAARRRAEPPGCPELILHVFSAEEELLLRRH
jgi:cobalt-precorrin-5B (C1)-methyltransferase